MKESIKIIQLALEGILGFLRLFFIFLIGVSEYRKLIIRNPIFLERVEGVGVIGVEEAINITCK